MINPFEVDLFSSSSVSSDFCTDVVISEDSEVIAFNAPFHDLDENGANSVSNAGAVFVRVKSGVNWINEYKLVSPNREIDGVFGHHIAIAGTRAGAGLCLIVTARGELSGRGRAYVYRESGGVFVLADTILETDTVAGDKFGFSVAVTEYNNYFWILIGAPFKTNGSDVNVGRAYLWSWSTTFGATYSASIDPPVITPETYFGYTLDRSAVVSEIFAIGAREPDDSGRVYLYYEFEVFDHFQTLALPSPVSFDNFGSSYSASPTTFAYYPITVSADGTTVVVGAYGAETNDLGNVTVWEGTPGTADYAIVKTFLGSDVVQVGETSSPFFGSSVHIVGDLLLIGAQEYDSIANGNNNRGKLFYSEKENGVWGDLSAFPQPSNDSDAYYFGYKPHASADFAAVVSSDATGNVVDQGSVTVYQLVGGAFISATDVEAQEPVDFYLIDMTHRKR